MQRTSFIFINCLGGSIVRLLQIDELREGMVIAEDIISFGLLYSASGAILTEKAIEGLKSIDIKYVYVLDDADDYEKVVIIDNNLSREYKNTIDSFKNTFLNVKVGQKIIINELNDSLSPLVDDIITSNNILGRLRQIEVNDEYTYKHSINVSLIATMISKWMGFSNYELYDIALAGLLHDIGKSKVPVEILNKPSKLSKDEYEIMKRHTQYGYEILKNTSGIDESITLGALEHHERLDGKGYPLGLSGDKIHTYAKIIAVADIYDAMTSTRVYKEKVSPFKVAELIFQDSFGILDPIIANTFLKNIFTFYVGNIVKLNNDQIGTVVLVNKSNPTRPLVKTATGFVDLSKRYDYEIVDIIN